MNIDSTVLDVLGNAEINGNSLKLTGQLDRKLYVAVNKVLEAAGAKWNRKAQAHIFESDAEELMEQIILTGKVLDRKKELGFFPTPPAVVSRLLEIANIGPHHRVLEPSAGSGNILKAIGAGPDKVAVEIDHELFLKLVAMTLSGVHIIEDNFLDLYEDDLGTFDRIVMNPPFGKNISAKHVLHAWSLLRPNGILVSVMPSSVTFRTDSLNMNVRTAAESIESLPDGSFVESGTNVNTVIVTMRT